MLAVVRDVTEHKRRQQELEEEHDRNSVLIEQIPPGVVTVQDEESKFANRAIAELTGHRVEVRVGAITDGFYLEDDGL